MRGVQAIVGAERRLLGLVAGPYALANIGSAVASVVAVIVLTRLLAAQGYGHYAAVTGLVMIAQNAAFLPLQTAIIRFHARAADDAAIIRLASAVRLAFAVLTALTATLWWLAITWIDSAGVTGELALAGLAMLLLRGWLSFVQAWNRATFRPWTFLMLELLQSFGALVLAISVLQFLPNHPANVLWAGAAATALAAACCPKLAGLPFKFRGVTPLLGELLIYCAPLAVAFLASAILAVSDRLIIAAQLGAAAAGSYAVAFAIADRAMNLVLLPVPQASKPVLFAAWEAGGVVAARPVMLRSARWLIIAGLIMTTFLVIAANPLARLLAGPELAPAAAAMVPWLAVGSYLAGLHTHYFSLAFQLSTRTSRLIPVIVIPAVLNVAANLLLIPRFGIVAAGWTTVGGYGLALALAIALGRRHVVLPFPVGLTLILAMPCIAAAVLLNGLL